LYTFEHKEGAICSSPYGAREDFSVLNSKNMKAAGKVKE